MSSVWRRSNHHLCFTSKVWHCYFKNSILSGYKSERYTTELPFTLSARSLPLWIGNTCTLHPGVFKCSVLYKYFTCIFTDEKSSTFYFILHQYVWSSVLSNRIPPSKGKLVLIKFYIAESLWIPKNVFSCSLSHYTYSCNCGTLCPSDMQWASFVTFVCGMKQFFKISVNFSKLGLDVASYLQQESMTS